MERHYQLQVTSDTTSIDVSSVNSEEVARIAQLAGIIEPQKPQDHASMDSVDPMSAAPSDMSMGGNSYNTNNNTIDDGLGNDQMMPSDTTDTTDANVMHGLNDLRKNAGLPMKEPVPSIDPSVEIGEGNRFIMHGDDFEDDEYPDDYDDDFADPHGHSALRAGVRNQSCPTCGYPNRLTAADVSRGYQCDQCADAQERGMDIDYYDDQDMDENMSLAEDVAEYDWGHRVFKDEGEEIDEPDLIWQAVENPQRIKGSPGDNGLIQELHLHLKSQYQQYLEETERENDTGVMSPLSDPTKPSFDKDPLSDEEPVDDGSHSPMSTIVRQYAFK